MVTGNTWRTGAQLFPFVLSDTGMTFQMTSTYQLKTNSLCQRNNGALRGITKLKWKIFKKYSLRTWQMMVYLLHIQVAKP